MVKRLFVFTFVFIVISGGNQVVDLIAATPSMKTSEAKALLRPSLIKFQFKQQILDAAIPQTRPPEIMNSEINLQQEIKKKSKGRAFLQSLIFPGWGQHYAESKTMSRIFFATEVLLWSSYLGFTVWSNWLKDDYRTFAVTHAGINPQGKPKRYFVNIGDFIDIFEYNQAQLRNRDVDALYEETDEFFWRWDSEANRSKFEDMRIRSDRAANRAEFTLAAIFTNHVISAIHATLSVHKFNKRLIDKGLGFRIEFDGYSENRQVKLKVAKSF